MAPFLLGSAQIGLRRRAEFTSDLNHLAYKQNLHVKNMDLNISGINDVGKIHSCWDFARR